MHPKSLINRRILDIRFICLYYSLKKMKTHIVEKIFPLIIIIDDNSITVEKSFLIFMTASPFTFTLY